MKPVNDLEQAIGNLPLRPRSGLEQRILTDASNALARAPAVPPGDQRQALNTGIRIMRNKWFRYAVAAAIALAALGLLRSILPGWHDSGLAFAQVLQNIRATRTVTYTRIVEIEGLPPQTFHEMRMEPGLMRTSYSNEGTFEVIQIMDCSQARQIQIMPDVRKTYVTRYVNATPTPAPAYSPTNPFESMLQLGETSGQFIGEKMLDDRLVRGFHVIQANQQADLWADAATGLPVLVEITVQAQKDANYRQDASRWTFRDFTWNQDLDRQLFSLEPPAGYEVEEHELNLSPPSEKDLVETLRLWTDATAGAFPLALDRNAIPTPGLQVQEGPSSGVSLGGTESVGSVSGIVSTVHSDASPAQMKAAMDNHLKMMRGLDFAYSVRKLGWHYVGAGLTRSDTGKPVCWWRPKGSETRRVIYTDLTIRDVPPAELPAVPAATQPSDAP
jgi:outer membrane lipoprotein-sorting protein